MISVTRSRRIGPAASMLSAMRWKNRVRRSRVEPSPARTASMSANSVTSCCSAISRSRCCFVGK
jgi:hypothetical protein